MMRVEQKKGEFADCGGCERRGKLQSFAQHHADISTSKRAPKWIAPHLDCATTVGND